MLVLSRAVSEKTRITVPPSAFERVIEVVPVEVRGRQQKVRIGFEADRDIRIVREDVIDCREKIQGDESDIADLGRKRGEFLESDEVADAFVESEMIDHGV